MNKPLLLFPLFFVFFLSIVQAADVAYILINPGQPETNIVSELTALGFSVDLIDNEDIDTVNLSSYRFMVIPDQIFSNEHMIPVNQIPAILLNSKHMDEWDWVPNGKISTKSSSLPLTAHVNDGDHFIAGGISGDVTVFTSSAPDMHYLHRFYRALDTEVIASVDNATELNTLNGVIVTAIPGTQLKNGVVSNTTTVFFGITDSEYWTASSKQLFRNAARWLTTDFIPPTISNVQISNITNSSALITWETDKEANYTFSYGPTGTEKTVGSPSLQLTHGIELLDLSEKTTYYFTIRACNRDNVCNTTIQDSFDTLDFTAPYLVSSAATDVTNTSANVSAVLNEEGYVTLHYGSTGFDMTAGPSGLETEAHFLLSGLTDKTTYDYFVEMCDVAGNCRNSTIFGFTTTDITAPKAPSNFAISVVQPGNYVELSWDLAVDDTSFYNIYFADTEGGFDFSNANDTTASNSYVDMNAPSYSHRYYVVRAEDAHGNEEGNTNILGKFDLDLSFGQNLVSFGINPVDASISAVMHQDGSYKPVELVKKFDSDTQEFVDSTFSGSTWNNSITLEPGYGYFFKSNVDGVFTIVGRPAVSTDLSAKEGMNLFGLVSLDDSVISSVIVQTPADVNVTEVGKRNADGSYDLSTYDGAWVDDFTLESRKGYWLKAKNDFTLRLEP